MPKNCILPQYADKLKEAFRKGEMSIEKLYSAPSSKERLEMFRKYVGESAEMTTAKFEKSILMPNQKKSLQQFVKTLFSLKKPLYFGVTKDQADALSAKTDIRKLKSMPEKDRLNTLSSVFGAEMAEKLDARFKAMKKTGNLKTWEEKVLGTDLLKEDSKMLGALAKIETLEELGVLSETNMSKFMETLIEDSLGINLDINESNKLSELANVHQEKFDKLRETNDFTHENEANVSAYLQAKRNLDDFHDSLMPKTVRTGLNAAVYMARANLLLAFSVLKNSFLFQGIPALERMLGKRITSWMMFRNIPSTNLKEAPAFAAKQVAMAIRLYHKYGYDISRLQNLNDGKLFFGESLGSMKANEKDNALWKATSAYLQAVNHGPKWMAGGTDIVFANFSRADTSLMLANQFALKEQKEGRLPPGMTVDARAKQLLVESYSFTSKDPTAQAIRAEGILDAHKMNNTQPDAFADKMMKFRSVFKINDVEVGTVFIPFIKIASTVVSEGLKTASGFGIMKGIVDLKKASNIKDEGLRFQATYTALSDLNRYLGFTGIAILFSMALDDDDYIPPYVTMSSSDYAMSVASGGTPGSIRLFGKWIPLRYLPIVNIPLYTLMEFRRSQKQGFDYLTSYVKGLALGILETPGIKETADVIKKTINLAKAEDVRDVVAPLFPDLNSFNQWFWVRAIPSMASREMWTMLNPKDSKYDFLGREVEKANFFGIKEDMTVNIIMEFDRLGRAGFMPVVSNPKGEYEQSDLVNRQRIYASKVGQLIERGSYARANVQEKKNMIDSIRRDVMKGIDKSEKPKVLLGR
jgi:hypothetical protein